MARPIFFLGDLHLGRRPAGLGEVLAGFGLEARTLSPEAVLEAAIERALLDRARAVVFAGDLIDDEDDRFEAFAPLLTAVRRLREAGIPAYAVAGNHDVLALPTVCRRLEGLTLLGEDGHWELLPLPTLDEDDPPVDLLGWSFPDRHVHRDPTADPGLARTLEEHRAGAHLLGVIHGDLDRPGSAYAPLDGKALRATGADAFLLGHIHTPHPLHQTPAGERPLGYLGSVCALDPGEPGVHGPWRLDLGPELRLRQLPLSPVRFERLELELDDERATDADAILRAIAAAAAEQLPEASDLRLVCLRVTVRGRLQDRSAVEALERRSVAERSLELPGLPAVVETLLDRTEPAIDLQALGATPTPVGQLARRILALQGGDAEAADDLLEAAARKAKPYLEGRWALPRGEALEPALSERLLAAAWDALDTLLAQTRGSERR